MFFFELCKEVVILHGKICLAAYFSSGEPTTMAAETQLLDVICEDIGKYFVNHPFIAVRPIKGSPPDQYEVTYCIRGIYKDDRGRLQQASHHVVSIAIPFGFPHFPPLCRPLTPIFHPDFDPAAIRLGEFWNVGRSLPELIIFIGRMISGELFSRENSFNLDAAAWYRDNTDKLPFARLESRSDTSPTESFPSDCLTDPIEIDMIEDEDLHVDVSNIGLDRTTGTATSQSEVSSAADAQPPGYDIDMETIWLLSGQKRFYQLRNLLENPAGKFSFDGQEALSKRIKASIQEARQIYKEGEDLEHRGLPAKALEKYTAVEELVSDFPKIADDIRRTEQAKDLLGDWVQGKDGSSRQEPAPHISKSGTTKKKHHTGDGPPVDSRSTMFNRMQISRINVVPIAIFAGFIMITVPPAYVYFSDTGQYNRAVQLYSECTAQLTTKGYKEASQACSAALRLAQDIAIIKKQEGTELIGKIDAILNSEDLQQGLAGNVLVNGSYLPRSLAESLMHTQKTISEGDLLASGANWEKAIDVYKNGVLALEKEQKLDPSVLNGLKLKLQRSQSHLSMEKGNDAMTKKQWQQAIDHFNDALAQIRSLPPEEQRGFRASLHPQLNKCTFLLLKQQGDQQFASSDWTGAFTSFQQAISLGGKLDQSEETTLNSIQADIVRADLYTTIKNGKVAFAKNEWNEAIEKFARASKILMDNPGLLNQEDADRNLHKLSRIMLQASIIRDQRNAEKLIAEKRYREAEKDLQQIARYIDSSPLKAEKEFEEIRRKISKSIINTQNAQFISDKITYLEDHFQIIFAENYPAGLPESLSSPVITFVKQENDKLLFKMQCIESGRGKPMKLIMYYSFTKNTGAWAFHSDTVE